MQEYASKDDRHYVLYKQWEDEYKKLAKRDNICGLGNTILDNFYLNNDKKSIKNYVIYAPHYSFTHDLNKNKLPPRWGRLGGERFINYKTAPLFISPLGEKIAGFNQPNMLQGSIVPLTFWCIKRCTLQDLSPLLKSRRWLVGAATSTNFNFISTLYCK